MDNLDPRPNDIYTDPALADGASQDPIHEFLKVWWRQILYSVLGLLALTYLITSFRQAYEDNLSISADHFDAVRESFEKFEAAHRSYRTAVKDSAKKDEGTKKEADAKKDKDEKAPEPPGQAAVDDAKKKLDTAKEQFNQTLAEAMNQSREPYKHLRNFYLVKLARVEGDLASLEAKLPEVRRWKEIDESDPFLRLQGELAALTAARALADSTDKAATAREMLRELGADGSYAAVPAAIALADLAQTDEEGSIALALLKDVLSKNPEQADLLRDHIARLSASTAPSKFIH